MRLPVIKEKFAITNKSVFPVYDILMGFSTVGQKKMHKGGYTVNRQSAKAGCLFHFGTGSVTELDA